MQSPPRSKLQLSNGDPTEDRGEYHEILDRVDAARVDGRARNVLYRMKQLQVLHSFLMKRKGDMLKAIQKDLRRSMRESEFEVSYSLEIIEKQYTLLNFEESLQKERNIARGKTTTDWREPLGTVGILYQPNQSLSSVISPLSASIAAGNCAILISLIEEGSTTFPLIEELISSLDNDAYATIKLPSLDNIAKQTDSYFQSLVLQSSSPIFPDDLRSTNILRPLSGRSFAIVDRSCANLKSAASEIAQIKFLQGGKSPFAPSFVLVHEVVKAEFLREFLTAITKYFPENIPLNHKEEYEELSELQRRLANSEAGYGRIVMSGNTNAAETAQLEVAPLVIDGDRRRGAQLCKLVGDAPILPIFSIRSLDDAIDYASEILEGSALALYAFAGSAEASYLGQFTDTRSVFINGIPPSLAVGPAFPDTNVAPDTLLRYTTEMFSVPKLFSVKETVTHQELDFLPVRSHEALVLPDRPEGKRLDFFLQGLAVGGVTLLTLMTASIAITGWTAWRYLRK